MVAKKSTAESAAIVYLRGIAAFGVVLYHVREDLWIGWNALRQSSNVTSFDKAAAWLSIPTPFLGSGVILFFLLSGFCISLPYVGFNGRTLNIGEYAVRRFFRIYPPYIIAVIFTLVIELILLNTNQVQTASYSSYISHIFMVQNYTTGPLSSNGALWTLPVELELYIAFPFVFMILKKWGNMVLIAFTGFVSILSLILFIKGIYWLGSNFAMYWVVWCSGVLLAKAYANGNLRKPSILLAVTALLSLSVAVIAQVQGTPSPYLELLFGYFYLVLLWYAITTEQYWNHLLPAFLVRVFTILGTCSFSLYLIHKPIFKLCGILWVDQFGGKPVNFLIPLAFSLLMVVVAWGFYLVIEAPTHVWAKKLSRTKQSPPLRSVNNRY